VPRLHLKFRCAECGWSWRRTRCACSRNAVASSGGPICKCLAQKRSASGPLKSGHLERRLAEFRGFVSYGTTLPFLSTVTLCFTPPFMAVPLHPPMELPEGTKAAEV
jgi:hypothetical protein